MDRFLLRSPLLAGLLTVWLLVVIGALITAFILNYTDVQEHILTTSVTRSTVWHFSLADGSPAARAVAKGGISVP